MNGAISGAVSRAVSGGENDLVSGEMLKTALESLRRRDEYRTAPPKPLAGTSG